MKIAIIGGGAGGMMSAIMSARNGAETVLFEANEKLGKKIYITGKGRCNLTNACMPDDFLLNVVSNSKFLYSSINKLSPYATMSFFDELGLKLVVERGNRVFPESQKASDVTKSMEKELSRLGVLVLLNTPILNVTFDGKNFVVESHRGQEKFDKVIVATGGVSYPSTGSTGDGYSIAKKFGHKIVEPKPALAQLVTVESVAILEGLSLKNVRLTAFQNGKEIWSEFGEMLFTRKGLSGPIALSISSRVNRMKNVVLSIDLKPALDAETLDKRLIREFENNSNSKIYNAVRSLMPQRLTNYVLAKTGISGQKIVNVVTKEERLKIGETIKNLPFKLDKIGGFEESIVTAGGVDVKDMKPSMESKLQKGLYFVGETLDVDALTGGYNLQIAFSTGYVAGIDSAKEK